MEIVEIYTEASDGATDLGLKESAHTDVSVTGPL